MSIPYRVLKSRAPLGQKKETYYAKAIKKEEIDKHQLLNLLAKRSRMHEADCIKLLINLAEIIHEQLADGNSVRLYDIGIFKTTLKSGTVERAEDFKDSHIEKVNVNFLPDKRLSKSLNTGQFIKQKSK